MAHKIFPFAKTKWDDIMIPLECTHDQAIPSPAHMTNHNLDSNETLSDAQFYLQYKSRERGCFTLDLAVKYSLLVKNKEGKWESDSHSECWWV